MTNKDNRLMSVIVIDPRHRTVTLQSIRRGDRLRELQGLTKAEGRE